MRVEKAALFLLAEEKGEYELLESRRPTMDVSPVGLPKGDPLPHHLQKNERGGRPGRTGERRPP